nr:MAG TPA: hypothetical protein [Caudoviricetes sp.]
MHNNKAVNIFTVLNVFLAFSLFKLINTHLNLFCSLESLLDVFKLILIVFSSFSTQVVVFIN